MGALPTSVVVEDVAIEETEEATEATEETAAVAASEEVAVVTAQSPEMKRVPHVAARMDFPSASSLEWK